ncbi:hypothetical protein GF314_08670 [bacterium]|nr:hypothetical protein [bacterium]
MSFVELLGYLASALIVISLMMARLLWLRVVNLVGALAFTAYGVMIDAWPVVATNGIITVVNIVYLWRMTRTASCFELLEVAFDDAYLRRFLDFHGDDIRRYAPHAPLDPRPDHRHVFILRDMVAAGLVILEDRSGGQAWVHLDYAIRGYRDYRLGRYLYHDRRRWLRSLGIDVLLADPADGPHTRYHRRMGYEPQESGVLARKV